MCSLDVEALYPSLDIGECAKVIEQKLRNSQFEVKGLNWVEIALYLKFQLTDEEIRQNNLEDYCPTRLSRKGRPPTFTASGSNTDITKRLGPWVYTDTTPSDEEKKRMFCLAVRIMIEKTMSLHDYVFDGDIIRQKGGGSIGLDLTGVVADIYMDYWDEKFKEVLRNSNIEVKLYKRYKDDINLVLEIDYNAEVGRAENEAVILKTIIEKANSIHASIRVTGDIPSRYQDNRLPIFLGSQIMDWRDKSGHLQSHNITLHERCIIQGSHQREVITSQKYEKECSCQRSIEDTSEFQQILEVGRNS